MSDADASSFPDFGKLVPGFDFLQNLTKQAAASSTKSAPPLSNLGGWLAPTLNIEELDKRIQELKTVQFWLDQNATALKATIQALELQKMTLVTLEGMNFNMSEVANAFKLKEAASEPGQAKPSSGPAPSPSVLPVSPASESRAEPGKAPAAAGGVVDPMQWWGALTQQFQMIAADAMKDAAKKSAMDRSQAGLKPKPVAAKAALRAAAKVAPTAKPKTKAKAPARKPAGKMPPDIP